MTTTRQAITGALAGVAMFSFADAALARCDVTVTNVAANGAITVDRDVYINNRRSSEYSGPYTYHRTLTREQSIGAAQLKEYFLNRGGHDGRASGSNITHVTQRVVDNICEDAFDRVRIPEVRIPEQPVRQVEPPRQVAPPVRREVTPPVRQVAPPVRHAPETSLVPQARPSCGVQPVVVLEIPCDCALLTGQAAALEQIIEESLGIEVSIYQDWTENSGNDNYIRIGVQDLGAQGGTIHNNLTDENSDRFRATADGNLVNIEPGADYQQVYTYLMEELAAIGYELSAPAAETAAPAAAAPALSGQACPALAPRG